MLKRPFEGSTVDNFSRQHEEMTMTEETKTAPTAEEKAAAKAAAAEAKRAEKEAKKAAAAAERKAKADAKLAEKAAAKQAKEDAKAAAKQPSQNGVTRPKAGTTTGKVWDACDALSAETGVPAIVGDVMKRATGIAEATVRTQYAKWRKYHGVTGRAEKPASASAQ